MKRATVLTLSLLAMLMMTSVMAWAADETAVAEKAADTTEAVKPAEVTDKIVAYYFHGTRRCPSCLRIEAYSNEAIENGFADEIDSGVVEWRLVNYDEDGNKHYLDDYQLYTKSVILSHVVDGKEVKWKNLDKVWTLLGDKEKFVSYVQTETRAFMSEDAD